MFKVDSKSGQRSRNLFLIIGHVARTLSLTAKVWTMGCLCHSGLHAKPGVRPQVCEPPVELAPAHRRLFPTMPMHGVQDHAVHAGFERRMHGLKLIGAAAAG